MEIAKKQEIKKIVLAYSGGLDTSIILKWLKNEYGCEVVAFSADLGQGDELDPVREKALATGADKVYIDDLREEFVKDFVFPMFRASAIYEGHYLLGTSIARPLIAKRQMEIAAKEKCDAVSHGSTGKGNDQVRFELAYYHFNPSIKVVAPWRMWDLNSRQALIEYAKKNGIPIPVTKKRPWSSDRNLLHISFEAGILEDPWLDSFDAKNKDMFKLSVAPEDAPDKSEFVTLEFEQGICVAVNGRPLSPLAVMKTLNKLGGKHGVGRVDMVENRYVGMKSRGVYETPGGSILHFAHRQLESLTMDREVMHLRDSLIPKYAELVYYGFWFSPERLALQALVSESQKNVSGTVRVKLYKGNIINAGRKSPVSLYNPHIATMEADPTQAYNQDDATGFIRLNALRLKVAAQVHHKSHGGG